MATAIIRPTNHIYTYQLSYAERAYDNNTSTKLTAKSSGYPRVIFTNFDMSAIPADIVNGGKITNISLSIYGSSLTSFLQLRLVRDADSEGNYTDCGDAAIKPSGSTSTKKEYSFDFPKATEYWNNNISAFMNGGFQARLYYIDDASSIYEVYAVVEYEVPMITVSTISSPAEGGIVTGAGTYESGSNVTLTATPNSIYIFSHWKIGGSIVGKANPISCVLTENATVTAVFEKVQGTSKIRYGSQEAKFVFDTQKNKAKSVWYGKTQIL